ncbi:MAG: hypothetical protein QNJ46_25460 [Leptolyngbyaceae cyanobacterium MO_188.B28]|nr:hypothetical protein [Leptolyngbyaceae cyanobacterium MO_188.B28]
MFSSTKNLLSSIVDYAGLFPPAKLDMPEAMANYALYQRTPYLWMLDRFVLAASRLGEFEAQLPSLSVEENPAENQTRIWRLSVILSGDVESALNCIQAINRRDDIMVTAVECPPIPSADIESVLSRIPNGIDAFFELPLDQDWETSLARLQQLGGAAKVRTGGLTATAVPSPAQLGQFILACAEARAPFKATAGLHHPLPAHYRLTYEPDSLSAPMHGFLNVAIAAAFSYHHKITASEMLEILKEPSFEAFQFRVDGISWRHHWLTLSEIENVRRQFFRSFGSCSFQEPVEDLKRLKLFS